MLEGLLRDTTGRFIELHRTWDCARAVGRMGGGCNDVDTCVYYRNSFVLTSPARLMLLSRPAAVLTKLFYSIPGQSGYDATPHGALDTQAVGRDTSSSS
nr:hypothetical protein CFP56_70042 [Quercus suber]